MGCDIHITAQKRDEAGNWRDISGAFTDGPAPFDWRSYGMFAFLAGVRNYSAIPPLAEARGLPADMDALALAEGGSFGDHSFSWLSGEELAVFDYGQAIEDRRYTRQEPAGWWNGAATCEPGQGVTTTYRDFLDGDFFDDLEELKRIGAERVVFGFDS